jgi:multiple sugar transport system ATP-binding protein
VELHRRLGTTIVYVTHDQVEAMTMADRIAVISDGRLQQVGPPQAVYERPANLFVASFIGSPPMNTVAGTLSLGSGSAVVHTEVGSLAVGDPGAATEGTAVVAGIRPEHLALAPQGDTTLRATVENVELLGHERHVVCHVGDGLMTIRQPNDTPPPAIGEQVGLASDPTGVHLFDAATTERLN